MEIKKIEPSLIKTIYEFEKENFNDFWKPEMIESAFNSGRFGGFILAEKEEILSFVTYSLSVETADIESVVTKKELRGKGYAKLLIEELIKELTLKKTEKVFLEVRKSNVSAINLYVKCGFNKISERKKYYGDGEDALIYVRELK